MLVVSLGDLVLDVVVRAGARPRPRRRHARTRLAVGGRAGRQCRGVGRRARGTGSLARQARRGRRRTARADHLGEPGVELSRPGRPERQRRDRRPSSSQTGERSMFPDRGVAIAASSRTSSTRRWLVCDHLHVSGYALARRARRAARPSAPSISPAQAAPASASTSPPGARSATPGADRFRALVESLEPDVVFANEAEDDSLGGPIDGVAWILKRGAAGCSFEGIERAALARRRRSSTRPAPATRSPPAGSLGGPDLALEAAARCIQRVGPMP